MQDYGAVGGAAHARVGNADHVFDAFAQNFWGQGHVADFGHAGIAAGAAILQDHHAGFVNIEIFLINARVKIFDGIEDDGAASVLQEVRAGGGKFDDGAVGGEIAAQDGDAGIFFEGLRERVDYIAIPAGSFGDIFP